MDTFFDSAIVDIFITLAIAMICGMIIGAERILAHKTAGMRTYALVAMGAALFVIISDLSVLKYAGSSGYNSSVITAAIITGVGFLGTGLMVWRDQKTLVGLTTATGLWISAGIGMAIGFGFYSVGLLATFLTLFVFIVLWFVEQKIKHLPFHTEGATDGEQTPTLTDIK